MSKAIEEEELEQPEQLTAPKFHCTIPEDLLSKLSDRDKQVLIALNVIAQQIDWVTVVLGQFDRRQKAHGKLLEKLRLIMLLFFSKWSPLVWLLGIAGPWAATKLFKYLWP